MEARPLNHQSFIIIGGIRLNHLRLATLFLILTVLAALHTSIFGGGYNTITTDNIYVATTDNTVKSINTSVDDDKHVATTINTAKSIKTPVDDVDGGVKELLSPHLIQKQNATTVGDDAHDDSSGLELSVSPPRLIHKQNATIGEPYVNRWQRRFSDSENRGSKVGYLFFKHIRKAGGTTLRAFFYHALEHHHQSRTFDLSPLAQANYDDDIGNGKWKKQRGGRFHKRYYDTKKNRTAKILKEYDSSKPKSDYTIQYVEQEFDAMHWQCDEVDPRWKDSLRIITIRHPIERHLSEFFFSGTGNPKFRLNTTLLFEDTTYTNEIKSLINEKLPRWLKEQNHAYQIEDKEYLHKLKKEEEKKHFHERLFGRHYTDNFQLRSLAGVTDDQPISNVVSKNCTLYFAAVDMLYDQCGKVYTDSCPSGCVGPCLYQTKAMGPLQQSDLDHAKKMLDSFDGILINEDLDDERNSDFLSDLTGVPRDSSFALKNIAGRNTRVEKGKKDEKVHYYRNLLSKLDLGDILTSMEKENELELKLYEYAQELNKNMLDQWEKETAVLSK